MTVTSLKMAKIPLIMELSKLKIQVQQHEFNGRPLTDYGRNRVTGSK